MQIKKFPDTSDLAKRTNLNAKITEIQGKIPSLATNSAITTVENKIPNVILSKKTDYNPKISEIESKFNNHNHDKFITTPEFNNLAVAVFIARLAKAHLAAKTYFDTILQDISKRITSKKTKNLLVENELKQLQKFDSSYF